MQLTLLLAQLLDGTAVWQGGSGRRCRRSWIMLVEQQQGYPNKVRLREEEPRCAAVLGGMCKL